MIHPSGDRTDLRMLILVSADAIDRPVYAFGNTDVVTVSALVSTSSSLTYQITHNSAQVQKLIDPTAQLEIL